MHKNKQFSGWHRGVVVVSGLLGRYPKLVGRVGGYTLGLAIAVAACAAVVSLKMQQISDGHAQVLGRMRTVQEDAGALLTELNGAYQADCSADNLNRLRGVLFGHPSVRSIGLLDGQQRLYCSTTKGLLAEPVTLTKNPIDGSVGRYFTGTPVHLFIGTAPGPLRATVIERGRFQVLLDTNLTTEVFRAYADSVWAGADRQRRQVYRSAAGDLAEVPADSPRMRLDWGSGRLLVTDTAWGISPVSVQTVLRAGDVELNIRVALIGILGLSVFVGLLAGNGITARCRYLQSMDFRIRYLCDAANVVCHYQPIMDLASGRVVGCEVLARLRDGARLMYPDQFIPALTRQGLTWTFDAAVSQTALQAIGAALPPQSDFTVALNFFPQNMQRDTLHAHLQAALQAAGRSDLRIELEVTEYDFSAEIVPELRRLKEDGYFISIDDFGTGYSNLGIVKRVAPDYLKIDRSFVFEMEDATVRSSLIPEIIAIAKAVGSQVIAEGIETAAQAAQLHALGVQFGQGYHFARPMPLDDFLRFLQKTSPARTSVLPL